MISGTCFEDKGSGRAGAGGTSGVLMVLVGNCSGVLGFLCTWFCAVCSPVSKLCCVRELCVGTATSASIECVDCFTGSGRGKVRTGVIAEGSLGS